MRSLQLLLFVLAFSCDRPLPEPKADAVQLEKQIETLQSQLDELRKQANEEELGAQEDFLNEWGEFSKKMELMQGDERKADMIEAKIAELQKARDELLQKKK